MFSLADFIEQLERSGQLVRVAAEVDAELEIAAITRRVVRAGGPALFFENVRGCRAPVVTNLLGSSERMRQALGGVTVDEAVERIVQWRSPGLAAKSGWLERLRGSADSAAAQEPRVVRSGASQQVVELGRDVDLTIWPALRAWPVEARRTITAGCLVTVARQIEKVTVEVLGRDRLGLSANSGQHWQRALVQHVANGGRMPVVLVLGCHPLITLAASPGAAMFDALELAGVLGGAPIDLVKCRTHDLEVPAEAEIVIEGTIDPAEPTLAASPLAAETGYAAPTAEVRVIQIAAITYRLNPVFPAMVVDVPPSEASVIRVAVGRWTRPLIAQVVPELVDFDLGSESGPRQFCVVSIRKTYAQQARRVLAALWGLEWLMGTKFMVIVDEHVDVRDTAAVLRAVGANVDTQRDLVSWSGPAFAADHAASDATLGHRLGIDATAKLPGEATSAWPARLEESGDVLATVERRWKEYGLESVK